MPSNKQKKRRSQLQPQQSDYDTDTANVTDSVAHTMAPPPPARTITELNLLVLRRYIPDIERIVSIAGFAVVYSFFPETQQWEKIGVEGTLFVCQLSRSPYPRYEVVMLNRKSLDTFVVELIRGEDIEITEEYVIIQTVEENGRPIVYGLWIFSEDDSPFNTRAIVANAIQECAVRAEHSRASANGDQNGYTAPEPYNLDGATDEDDEDDTPVAAHPHATGQQIDLLSLFNKASESGSYAMPDRSQSFMSQQEPQHLQAQPSRFTSTADTDFFRTSHSPAAGQQQRQQSQSNPLLDLFMSAKNG